MSTRLPSSVFVAAAIALFGLTGCSGSQVATTPADEASSTSAESSLASAGAESEGQPGGREVPAECASLGLAPGAQLDGAALGECVAVALSSYGTGKMDIAGGTTGSFEFSYDPDFNVQGELTTPQGSKRVVYVGSEMWLDSGDGPVKGDKDSEVFEEQMAALAGEVTRQFADPAQTAQLIQGQPLWTVDEAMSSVTSPTGDTTEAYRIVSAGPFEWNGIAVDEFVLWYGEDWVPLSTQTTVSMMGMSETNSQAFYDLGVPVTITPLS